MKATTWHCSSFQDVGKEGLSLRGVAFVTVFGDLDGFGGSGRHLALLVLSLRKMQHKEAADGPGGFGGYGGFGRDG